MKTPFLVTDDIIQIIASPALPMMCMKFSKPKFSFMIPRKKSDFKIVPKAKRLKNPIFRYLMVFKKNFEAINGEFNELDIR